MMGRQSSPERLFYDFCLDEHVPSDHLLRQIDVFVDLESVRQDLKPFYSSIGRPSIDPELMIRMLIIVDVEASRAIRQAEVGAARTMIERVNDRFNLYPERLAGDSAYGAAEMVGWLVEDQGIEPHVTVIDKSERKDGTFSHSDFTYDHEKDAYICPAGKHLKPRQRRFRDRTTTINKDGSQNYRGLKAVCSVCPLKTQCCPNDTARRIRRSIYEGARDMAREIADTDAGQASRRDRKKVEMLFAHLKRILKLGRLRLRGPCGASDEFLLAATAQNLRKLAKLRPKLEPTAALA